MKNYSILRVGNEYVVQADEKSVLKIASRRRAAKTINDAAELMDLQRKPQAEVGSSIVCDQEITADAGIISDLEITLDPGITPDPAKVS